VQTPSLQDLPGDVAHLRATDVIDRSITGIVILADDLAWRHGESPLAISAGPIRETPCENRRGNRDTRGDAQP